MITEDYINFEVAKLLKEKGFEPPHDYRKCMPIMYTDKGEIKWGVWSDDWYPRITLQMAMKWLREVHSLYLDIATSFSQDGICYTFSCSNTMDLIQGTKGTSYHEYQTYEEACEAAIKYCLENLI